MSIHFHVTGGGVAIGALSEGHGATVSGSATLAQTALEHAFAQADAAVAAIAREQGRADAELQEVLAQLQQLKAQAQSPHPDPARGSAVLKLVRENFSWAWPAVKDLAALAWPAVLALLAG